MGNLLSYSASFNWGDRLIDRGDAINDLNNALDKAREWGDVIYKVPDLDSIEVMGQKFIEFILYYGFDEKARIDLFPWLTQTQHQVLVGLIPLFQFCTPKSSSNINDLNVEFPTSANSLIGFYHSSLEEKYIYNEETWFAWHSEYVATFNLQRRSQEKSYFTEFFVPSLNFDPNYINGLIHKKRVNPIFKRLDTPTYISETEALHGEQVQIHFNDKNNSALNIDGTWKHGKIDIPKDAMETLIKWGFRLPE